eukprot:1752643-Alexandrium_andersonii.AAC.1
MSQQARVLRLIVGAAQGTQGSTLTTPDSEIYRTAAKPRIVTQVLHNRLLYLARLITPGRRLEAVLQGVPEWQRMVAQDLALLHRTSPK